MASLRNRAKNMQLGLADDQLRPTTPYELTESGTFSIGDLQVNRQGILPSPDKQAARPTSSFTVTDLSELAVSRVLGRGAGGIVHLAEHKPSRRTVALKILNLTDGENKHDEIVREIKNTYYGVRPCEYIVQCYGCIFVDCQFHLVIEFMDEGSLADVIQRVVNFTGAGLPEDIIGCIAWQCCQGLLYIHKERHVIHRDLKPTNILVNKAGYVKIADFGMASAQLQNSVAQAMTFAGSVNYMAPERIHSKPYSFESDIWSLGLTLAECALGRFPYPTPKDFWDMLHFLDNAGPPQLPPQFTPACRDFINICLVSDPAQRAKIDNLVSHPFLQKYARNHNIAQWLVSTKSTAMDL